MHKVFKSTFWTQLIFAGTVLTLLRIIQRPQLLVWELLQICMNGSLQGNISQKNNHGYRVSPMSLLPPAHAAKDRGHVLVERDFCEEAEGDVERIAKSNADRKLVETTLTEAFNDCSPIMYICNIVKWATLDNKFNFECRTCPLLSFLSSTCWWTAGWSFWSFTAKQTCSILGCSFTFFWSPHPLKLFEKMTEFSFSCELFLLALALGSSSITPVRYYFWQEADGNKPAVVLWCMYGEMLFSLNHSSCESGGPGNKPSSKHKHTNVTWIPGIARSREPWVTTMGAQTLERLQLNSLHAIVSIWATGTSRCRRISL